MQAYEVLFKNTDQIKKVHGGFIETVEMGQVRRYGPIEVCPYRIKYNDSDRIVIVQALRHSGRVIAQFNTLDCFQFGAFAVIPMAVVKDDKQSPIAVTYRFGIDNRHRKGSYNHG